MNRIDKAILGKNVKALREAVGLSQHDFSALLEISKRSLASIELGSTNTTLDLISNISSFFGLSIDELTNTELKIKNKFRDTIIEFHSGNNKYLAILNKRPNLTFAINYELLKSNFLEKPREVNEVKSFLAKLGWNYLGTSISNALKRERSQIKRFMRLNF
ncbi:MAG: XRE family transcriptional regulator [Flavobacterium sp.]|nr:MAG: XRE family transcriptional regulator [Flavobacterium sp.]